VLVAAADDQAFAAELGVGPRVVHQELHGKCEIIFAWQK
jgi:hypothetical protein